MAKFDRVFHVETAPFPAGSTVKEFFTRKFETGNVNVLELRILRFNELYALLEHVYERENPYSGNSFEVTVKTATVTIFKVSKKGQVIQWRTFPESDNPQYHNCPRSILDKLSPPRHAYDTAMEIRQAKRWREACKNKHTRQTR